MQAEKIQAHLEQLKTHFTILINKNTNFQLNIIQWQAAAQWCLSLEAAPVLVYADNPGR